MTSNIYFRHKNILTAKGHTLEGSGVTPDKSVAVTLADLQSGRDAALEEAEKYFNKLKINE